MRRAGGLEAYRKGPVGSYLSGPTYVIWWLHSGLNGISFWGRPEDHDIRVITSALDAEFDPGVARHASIIDARYMDGVDPGAFDRLARYVFAHREALSRVHTGQAILRPTGLVGAVVAGFHAVLDTIYPVKVFAHPGPALDWLGVSDDAAVLDELDGIRAQEVGVSPVVVALRERLAERPGKMTVDGAARALGLSSRELQRQLRASNTRFKTEQHVAQIRIAKTLLLETSHDLKRIAFEVGCSSGQHFSALFRESVGVTPSQWRAQRSAVLATSVPGDSAELRGSAEDR